MEDRRQFRRCHEGKGIVKTVGHTQGGRQTFRRTDHAEIQFIGFERREDFPAALRRHTATDLGKMAQIGVEETGEISEPDGPRDAHPHFLARSGELFAQSLDGFLHAADEPGRFLKEKLAGGGEPDAARRPLQQIEPEAGFHPLHLPGDSALGQPSRVGRLGKAAMFYDEAEETEFVKIERRREQKLIHLMHQSIILMNFTQLFLHPLLSSTPTESTLMAEPSNKHPENVPGPYYVDDTCIDCDQCRSNAPAFFVRLDTGMYTYVHRQPRTPEEFAQAEAARLGCPTESIGNDGGDAGLNAPPI